MWAVGRHMISISCVCFPQSKSAVVSCCLKRVYSTGHEISQSRVPFPGLLLSTPKLQREDSPSIFSVTTSCAVFHWELEAVSLPDSASLNPKALSIGPSTTWSLWGASGLWRSPWCQHTNTHKHTQNQKRVSLEVRSCETAKLWLFSMPLP